MDLTVVQPEAIANAEHAELSDRTEAGPDQRRRQADDQAVGQSCAEHRGDDAGAAFHEERSDASMAKGAERFRRVHAARTARHHEHPDAAPPQLEPPRGGCAIRGDDDGLRVVLENLRVVGDAKRRVQDDPDGGRAFHHSDGQHGIVRQDRVQNGV